MSAQTSSSVTGQQSVNNFTVDDETVSVDGVTFHGFSPSNVSVTRTTTTKVTKTTRSRSPSPSRGQSGSSENLHGFPRKMAVRYDSEPESEAPVKFMSGVIWTPPSSKGMYHPHSVVIPVRSNASRKGVSPWRPVAFQPRSKDDTATYAFSSPPVPPPPPESDTEDFPPTVPPKPKVVRRKLYLSANQPQSDAPDEPPPPRMLTNNNQYPTSPTSPSKHHPNNAPPTSPKYQNYSQSPPKQDTYYQPVRPQRADSEPDQDSWPAPPPPLTSVDSKPQYAGTSPHNPAWSPQQPNPAQYQPIENKSPSAWTPASTNIKPVKEFRPVKLDLNAAPKPWKPTGAPQIERNNEPAPTSSSQPSTWQSPPPQRSTQHIGPVTNGDLHPSNEVLSSPYRPGDPQHDQDRYNPGYRPNEPQQRQPLSPQDSRRPEFRPAPEGYSSGLPRSVSPTVTLLQYQRDPYDLPEGAVYQKQMVDGDVIHTDTYYPVKTREVTKKTIHKEAPHYEGIGPQDESGLPVGLRAHVKEENRHDWYKEMFKTIHKQDRPEDQWSHDPTVNSSPPRSPPQRRVSPNTSARNTIDRYHQQPRSIIDYEPGASSLAERDKSPTSHLYNPPVEPITAVQNTKRSTTLPRDFASFNQVPAESPSSRHGSYNEPPSRSPKREEPIRSSSRPQSSTLPRAKSKPRPDSSGLSAAERLGIKSPPPQRTQSTGSKPTRHSSGSDKIYNYRDPPPTLDKTKAERLIEEERKKKERLQLEEQQHRRHSDYAPIKSPIITNDRFNDPIISSKEGPQPGRKQEVKACALALYPFKAQSHKELSFDKGDTIYLLRKIDKNWYEGEHHGHAGIFPSSYIEVVTSLEDAKKAQLHGPGLEGKARAKYKFSGETQTELNFNKGEYIELVKKIDANWWEGRIGNRKGIFPTAYVEVLREPTGAISPPAVKSPPPTAHAPIQPFSQQPIKPSPLHQKMSHTLPSKGSARSSLGSAGSQGSYGSSQREPDRYFEQRSPKPSKTLAAGQDFFVASFAYAPQNEDEIELQEGDLVNVLEKCDDGWFVGMSERTGMFGTFPGNYVYKYES